MLSLLHNRTAQSVSGWIGIFTFIFGWLAKMTPEWFGHLSWPQAILAGIGGALAGSFCLAVVLLVGASAIRLIKRRRRDDIDPVVSAEESVYCDFSLIQTQIAELQAMVRRIVDDYQRMSGLEARVDGAHEGLANAIAPLVSLPEKLEAVRVDGSIAVRDIQKLQLAIKDHRDRALGSFHAFGARERIDLCASEIRQDASDLYNRLLAGEAYDFEQWEQWENIHSHWQTRMNEWIDAAQWYAIAVRERTLTVDDRKYGGDWTVRDDQFPNAESVRRFKKFRIVQQQWEELAPDVERGITLVAFNSITEIEARSGRPVG